MYKIGLCFLLKIPEAGDLKGIFFPPLASLLAEAYGIYLWGFFGGFFCKLLLNKMLHMDARIAYWVFKQMFFLIFFVVSIFWVLSLRVVKGSASVINYHKSWQIWVTRNAGFAQIAYLCALCNDEEQGTCQPDKEIRLLQIKSTKNMTVKNR